jgi:RecJ-like exonuclease
LNIYIFTHGDTDGICAGAIALAANLDAHVFFSSPYRLLEALNKIEDSHMVIIMVEELSREVQKLEVLLEVIL